MSTLVHIVPSLNMGGLEMLLQRLVRLQTPAWKVHVICLDELGPLADAVRDSGAVVHDLRGLTLRPWKKLARIAALLRKLRPDVVHSHNPSPHLYALLAYLVVRPGAVVHTRHGQQRPMPALAPLVNRLSARWTARTIAVSEDVAAMVQVSERFPASKCTVLRNGVDMSVYGAARGAIHEAITVGRLDPLKDHATLLRAAALVRLRHPGFRLRIVGDGAERGALLALREELRLQDCVEFLGVRRDIPELLAESGLYVISSISEGVPLSLLEAMASRLPVVSTRVGGIPEVIEEGRTGRLVAPRDPAALAEAISSLIERPDEARQLAEAGRNTATMKYGLDRLADHYEAIYASALAGA